MTSSWAVELLTLYLNNKKSWQPILFEVLSVIYTCWAESPQVPPAEFEHVNSGVFSSNKSRIVAEAAQWQYYKGQSINGPTSSYLRG